MDFYAMEVRKIVNAYGKEVEFNYTNIYFNKNKAVRKAEKISKNENVLRVCILHCVVRDNGTTYVVDESIPYYYIKEMN